LEIDRLALQQDRLSVLVKIISGGNSLGILSYFGECVGVLTHMAIIILGYSAILMTSTLSLPSLSTLVLALYST